VEFGRLFRGLPERSSRKPWSARGRSFKTRGTTYQIAKVAENHPGFAAVGWQVLSRTAGHARADVSKVKCDDLIEA